MNQWLCILAVCMAGSAANAGGAAEPCRRVIPYSPALATLMFEMGLSDYVVGVTRWTSLPPGLKRPIVGDAQSADPEAVLAVRPDCILVQQAHRLALERIVAMRPEIRLVTMEIEKLADISGAALLIGKVTGKNEAAEKAVAEFDRRLENIRRRTENKSPPRVLFVVGTDHPLVAGPRTFAAELIELAGGINVGADVPGTQRWRVTEMEAIVKAQPDVLVCQVDNATQESAARAYWQRWTAIPAVAKRRVFVVSSANWTIPSLHLSTLAESLFEMIHGTTPSQENK